MNHDELMNTGMADSLLRRNPIAVIGMASVFPQARNIQQYWDNIIREVDSIVDVPASRWSVEDYYDPDPTTPDKTYCKRGGFIPDIDFNPIEFGIPPNILEATDISQLLALVVAKEALEDSGYSEPGDLIRDRTGVVLGVGVGRQLGTALSARLQYPIWERVLKSSGVSDEDAAVLIEKMKSAYVSWQENSFPGALGNVVAGRVANRLNLGGMNCVVDAACASSLGAMKMAISELLERRADMMVTGGVDTDNSIMMYMCFSKTPAFTQSEIVKPFDVDSDGMMVGEGIGMLVLRRLEDAERDNNRIYAVIRGIGTSSDGRFKSIYAPRAEGQVKALRRAYEDAGCAPSSIGLLEAHGTGTNAGDPAEVEALNEVFSESNPARRSIALGSVKSQIGHTKAAAGAASAIKAVLSLHHKVLPPTINVSRPDPALKLDSGPFYLNTKTRPWIRPKGSTRRRAGVSSFGFGGTNFHLVLEEYEEEHQKPYRLHSSHESILFSAETPAQLLAHCKDALTKLQSDEASQHFGELILSGSSTPPASYARIGFAADSVEEARELLEVGVETLSQRQSETAWQHPKGVFYRQSGLSPEDKVTALFAGQGSQYVGMGTEVALNMPEVRRAFSTVDKLYQDDGLEPVSRFVFPVPAFEADELKEQEQALRRTEYAQPAIGALSAGLYQILRQAGFAPDFVAGHSFGELTALWAAGVLSEQDYFALVKARGLAMAPPDDPHFDAGAMIAVAGEVERIQEEIRGLPDISIANLNANNQAVLAGESRAIESAQTYLSDKGYSVRRLPVSAAFHTPLVGHAQRPFAEAVSGVSMQPAQIAVFANSTGEAYPPDPESIRRVLSEHMLRPVLFKHQIENMYAAGARCFVEFGPKGILTNLVKNILAGKPHEVVALNASSSKGSDRQLCEAAVQLRVIGVPLQDIDPYRLAPTAHEAGKKSPMIVRLNANNYVSDQTRQAFEQALQDGHRIAPVNGGPAPIESQQVQSGVPAAQPADPTSWAKPSQDSGETDRPISSPGQGRNHRSIQQGLEHGLRRFADHQAQTSRLHEQYLTAQMEHTSAYASLMREQYALLSNGSASPHELEAMREVLGRLEQSLREFGRHQEETSRIHQRYLDSQADFAKSFVGLLRSESTTGSPVADAHELTAPPDATGPPESGRIALTAPVQVPATEPLATEGAIESDRDRSVPSPPIEVEASLGPGELSAPASPMEIDVSAITATLLEVVSEKTGYPAEVIELHMDLEADLGIDSIKRVEILGAMQEHYADLPKLNPEELAELRTLGQIIEYIQSNASAAGRSPSTAATPAAPIAQEVSGEPPASPVEIDVSAITATLLEVVSDKTGYPSEVVELHMDLEADLGIDSIKRVEILGAMQEHYADLPKLNPEELAELRTLGQIIEYIQSNASADGRSGPAVPASAAPTEVEVEPAAASPGALNATAASPAAPAAAQASPETPSTTAASPAAPAAAEPSPAPPTAPETQRAATGRHSTSHDAEQLAVALLAVVSDATGYPIETLETGMELEADLGIDAIKMIEILGLWRDTLDAPPDLDLEELPRHRTLGRVIEALAGQLQPAAELGGVGKSRANGPPGNTIRRNRVDLKPLPPPDTLDVSLAPNHCCLVTDDGSLTTVKLVEALSQRGWPVVVLGFPAALVADRLPLPEGVERVTLHDLSEEHLAAQLRAIAESYGPVGAFIHLNPAFPAASSNGVRFEDSERAIVKQVFLIAKHLKRSLTQAAQYGRSSFVTVSRLDGHFGLGSNGSFGVIGAGLPGLAKTLSLEWPAVYCRAIDLSPDLSAEQSAARLVAELHDHNRLLAEVGYSDQGRSTLVCVEARPNGQAELDRSRIDSSSVFVVSGGAKGITAQCVLELAARFQCGFILLGRTPTDEPEPEWVAGVLGEAELKRQITERLASEGEKPTPARIEAMYRPIVSRREIHETLRAIEAAGGRARYVSVDITDARALQAALSDASQSLGPVTGLVHGAGNLADKWIENKTERDFELVYSTKVDGLRNLLSCLPIEQLQHVVMFSSTAGFYGNIGQSDYALANEVLNKAAHIIHRQYPACHTTVINWGPWDGGMVSPELKKVFAMRNIEVIPTQLGRRMFLDELTQSSGRMAQVVISSPITAGTLAPEPVEPPAGAKFRIRRTVSLEANPFLRDHVIGGQPVLPFACAAGWMISACEELLPGFGYFSLTDLRLLSGIVLAEGAEVELVLDLEQRPDGPPGEQVFGARVWSENGPGNVRHHYQGQVKLLRQLPEAPTHARGDPMPSANLPGRDFYGNGALFHGPSLQGVDQVLSLTAEGATMRCLLPRISAADQGQFPARTFNPFTTDVQLHGALIWTDHFFQEACLPTRTPRLEQFRETPFDQEFFVSMEVKSKTDTGLVVDVFTHDAQGRIYNQLLGFEATVSKRLYRSFG